MRDVIMYMSPTHFIPISFSTWHCYVNSSHERIQIHSKQLKVFRFLFNVLFLLELQITFLYYVSAFCYMKLSKAYYLRHRSRDVVDRIFTHNACCKFPLVYILFHFPRDIGHGIQLTILNLHGRPWYFPVLVSWGSHGAESLAYRYDDYTFDNAAQCKS